MVDKEVTLRNHLGLLEDMVIFLGVYKNMEYGKYLQIVGKLEQRIDNIKIYLNIPLDVPKKRSYNDMFKDGLKFLKY